MATEAGVAADQICVQCSFPPPYLPTMIRDLFPEATYAIRHPLRMGLFFGLSIGGFLATIALSDADMRSSSARMAIVIGGPFIGGWAFVLFMQRAVRKLYRGEAKVVPPAPPGEFAWKVLASRITRESLAIGGHLYAGPTHLAFMPHSQNLPKERALAQVTWGEVRQTDLVPHEVGWFRRLLDPSATPDVRIATDDETWVIRHPEPAQLLTALMSLHETAKRVA